MGITCEEVWRDISDYIDDELAPKQRAALNEHFAECRHCTAVLEGTCNVIRLYRDERVLAPPQGFGDRLEGRINQQLRQASQGSQGTVVTMRPSRRAVLAWALSAAAAVPLGLALFSASRLIVPAHDPKRPTSGPDARQLPETVAISLDQDDKVYHIAGCSHLHGKPKFIRAEEAIRDGYTPCVYCIGKPQPKKNS